MFNQDTFHFLENLSNNNQRDWFNQHKDDYEIMVRTPALAFITEMQPLLAEISTKFLAIPKKMGGSLMRVYRDTRFHRDVAPFKTNIGIHFRHFMGKDVHAPGFYVHITPQECYIGAGIWRPDGAALSQIRHFIDDNPRAWLKALNHQSFHQQFQLTGESLKRPPRGFSADHQLIDDLKRKDFVAVTNITHEQIVSINFPMICAQYFQQCDAFMYYLCTALSLPYRSSE